MRRRYDHIDLRVRSLAEARPFYRALLPALGFTRDVGIEGWLQFETADGDAASEFFGITESPQHVANECRIAFWADSASEVDRAGWDCRPSRGAERRRSWIRRRVWLLCRLFRRSLRQSFGNLPPARRSQVRGESGEKPEGLLRQTESRMPGE